VAGPNWFSEVIFYCPLVASSCSLVPASNVEQWKNPEFIRFGEMNSKFYFLRVKLVVEIDVHTSILATSFME
jgi:hypothetical protein